MSDIEKRNQNNIKREIKKHIPLEVEEVVTTKKYNWEDSY